MLGTRAPTAKNLVATAMAMRPLLRSWKMIDQVILRSASFPHHPASTPGGVALHAARVGRRLAPRILARGRCQPAFRPLAIHLDLVTALLEFVDRVLGHPAFQHQHAGARRAWPERGGEVLAVPGRRVD